MPSTLSPELIAAYRTTMYIAELEPGLAITLLIDSKDSGLALLYRKHCVRSAAVLTACNPFSQPTLEAINLEAQRLLVARVDALGLPWVPAAGVQAQGTWKTEPSILVLGINLAQATLLAQDFRQNAFVFCDRAAVPCLVICAPAVQMRVVKYHSPPEKCVI